MASRLLPATLLTTLTLLLAPLSTELSASNRALPGSRQTVAVGVGVGDPGETPPTINEFFPEERPLSDCLSSLPKPDCGSRARGGWALGAVFLAMTSGLGFITWRIVHASRRTRRPGPDQATP